MKKSLDDFNHILDQPQGIHNGLMQDVKNVWQRILDPAETLSDQALLAETPVPVQTYYHKSLYQPLPLYQEYLEQRYSSDAVAALLSHPLSDRDAIRRYDALINTYNKQVDDNTLTPLSALHIYKQAMELFGEVVVYEAQEADIPGIVSVHESNLLEDGFPKGTVQKEDLAQRGFLVHGMKPDKFKAIITDVVHHSVLVAKENGEVVGYILAYDLVEWKKQNPEWSATVSVDEETRALLLGDGVLYVHQVARSPLHKGKEIGKKLEEDLFFAARRRGYHYLVAEILEQPIENAVSKKLHLSLGYDRRGSVKETDEMVWGFWMKDLTQ